MLYQLQNIITSLNNTVVITQFVIILFNDIVPTAGNQVPLLTPMFLKNGSAERQGSTEHRFGFREK